VQLQPRPKTLPVCRATLCRGTDFPYLHTSLAMTRSPASDPARLPGLPRRFQCTKGYYPSASTPSDHLMDDITPYSPIYSFSEVEKLALREFLDENLNNQFIRPSQSSASPPVLARTGSLRLAVHDPRSQQSYQQEYVFAPAYP
jgi:hypothetical protein